MAKTPLFQNWSWKRTLPEPFDKEDAVSTASYSKYCIGSTKKATLHSAALSAILAYMDMILQSHPAVHLNVLMVHREKNWLLNIRAVPEKFTQSSLIRPIENL